MRTSSLTALALVLLLAGCLGSGGGQVGTGDQQPDHMPRMALFDDMVLLTPGRDAAYFDAYGLTENPGSANVDRFTTSQSLVPETAYVALYAYDGDRNRIFTAATLHFATTDDVDAYLEDHAECDYPTPGRQILVDGKDVTLLVAGTTTDGSDADLMAVLAEAEDDIQDRTGAKVEC